MIHLVLVPLLALVPAAYAIFNFLPRNPTTITVSTVTITEPPVTITPAAPSPSLYTNRDAFRVEILNSTNTYRWQCNATALVWNATLAHYASIWASHCRFAHSHGPYGENLAEGYPSPALAVDAWGNERAHYNFNSPTGFSEQTGHFTQLVWKSTTSTGCGAVDCTGKNRLQGWFIVCEYWPPGNVVGDNNFWFRQNVQSSIHSGQSSTMTTSTVSAIRSVAPTVTATTAIGIGNESGSRDPVKGLWSLGVLLAALVIAGGLI